MNYLLDNPFNLSINPIIIDETIFLAFINVFNLYLLICIMIYNIYDNHKKQKKQNNIPKKIKICEKIMELDTNRMTKYNDLELPRTIRAKLMELLDTKCLERNILLHFIFNMHGEFISKTYKHSYESSIKNTKTNIFNSFYEYKFWCDNYDGKNNFNLDETLPYNYFIIDVGSKVWQLNIAHMNFLCWVYYSGLYDYLFSEENIHIKKNILDNMNKNKILTGNNFLKYQLFLINYEEMYSSQTNSPILSEADTETSDSETTDTTDSETTENDETNRLVNVLSINDIDKYMFLEGLKNSFYNICKITYKSIYKSIFNVWE